MDWTVYGPLLAKIMADYIIGMKAQSGLTLDQLWEKAGVKLDANDRKLLEDLIRLQQP